MATLLTLGMTYKVYFIESMSALDNVYTCMASYTYEELTNMSDSLLPTYTAAGLSSTDLDNNLEIHRNEIIFKLMSPDDESISYYVTESMLSSTPDPTIKKYPSMVMTFDIGIYPEEEDLITLSNTISEVISSVHGITTEPVILAISENWLTDAEYEEAIADKKQTAKQVVNYYSKCIELQNKLTEANNRIKTLEQIIIDTSV